MPTYTDDQRMIRDAVRDFVQSEVRPRAVAIDEARECPVELVRKMAALNLLGIPFPEAEGGTGADFVTLTLAIQEIARASGSLGMVVAAHTAMVAYPLHRLGEPSVRSAWIGRLLSGETLGGVVLPPSSGKGLTSREQAGKPLWSGGPHPTLSGSAASLLVAPTPAGLLYVAPEKGVARRPVPSPLGLRACGWCETALEGALAAALLPAGTALFEAAGRVAVAALAIGLLRGSLDRARPYVLERRQFGKPLASFDPVRAFIAEMSMDIEIGEELTTRAAVLLDRGEDAARAAIVAKAFAADAACRGTRNGVQALGGYGYLTEYEVERYFRDAAVCEVCMGRRDDLLQEVGRTELGG